MSETTTQNGQETKELSDRELYGIAANVASLILSRAKATNMTQFAGDRDLAKVFGYKAEIDPADYIAFYLRGDIAARIVDLPPRDTWKKKAVVNDGDDRSDEADTSSEFINAWKKLVKTRKVFHYLSRLDRIQRLGQYAILVIGTRDGQTLDKPLGRISGPESITYLMPVLEKDAVISDLERDEKNERFGKPTMYRVDFSGTDQLTVGQKNVHWSRVLHVAENLLDNDVLGLPALERFFNRLYDLEKLVGSSAEAFWLNVRKGLAFIAREGVNLPDPDSDTAKEVKQQLDEYAHGLRRILTLYGVDTQELGASPVDPEPVFNVILALLAAAAEIPQRILIGSERGNLASSQDAATWAGIITDRRNNFAEPGILRAFIDWCIKNSVLPSPSNDSGDYKIIWPSLFELTDLEKADLALKIAQALKTYVEGMKSGAHKLISPETFLERWFDIAPDKDASPIENIFAEAELWTNGEVPLLKRWEMIYGKKQVEDIVKLAQRQLDFSMSDVVIGDIAQ